jgi:hypothetical protein
MTPTHPQFSSVVQVHHAAPSLCSQNSSSENNGPHNPDGHNALLSGCNLLRPSTGGSTPTMLEPDPPAMGLAQDFDFTYEEPPEGYGGDWEVNSTFSLDADPFSTVGS